MKEFLTLICWPFITTIPEIINALITAGFKGVRIFFNLRDLPYIKKPNQTYIKMLFDTLPNGCHTFTFQGHPSYSTPKDKMRTIFDFCKKYNWLPLVCLGTSEEPGLYNWIGRVPSDSQHEWLGQFAQELGTYLTYTMQFERADCEIWNEYTKAMTTDKYCNLSIPIAKGWIASQAGKVGIFSDDILRQDRLNEILARPNICNLVNTIFTHIGVGSEDSEWNNKLIAKTTQRIKSLYPHLDQVVSELSVNGTWSRLNQLPENTAGYGLIGSVRHQKDGTATRIDDIWMYNDNGFVDCQSDTKAEILRVFNNTHFKILDLGGDTMKLTFDYKKGSRGMGVKVIQKCANRVLNPKTLLLIDGNWGPATDKAVIEMNKYNGFTDKPEIIDYPRFQFYVGMYPDIWNSCEVSWAKGER